MYETNHSNNNTSARFVKRMGITIVIYIGCEGIRSIEVVNHTVYWQVHWAIEDDSGKCSSLMWPKSSGFASDLDWIYSSVG